MTSWAIFGAAADWSKGTSRMSTEEMTEQVLTVTGGRAEAGSGAVTVDIRGYELGGTLTMWNRIDVYFLQ